MQSEQRGTVCKWGGSVRPFFFFWCCIAAEKREPREFGSHFKDSNSRRSLQWLCQKLLSRNRVAQTPVLPCRLQSPPERRRPGQTWTWPSCDCGFPADTPPSYPRCCTPSTTKAAHVISPPLLSRSGCAGLSASFWQPTFRMLSLGLLVFSWRERVRDDLRWCLRTFPSLRPPWVPS